MRHSISWRWSDVGWWEKTWYVFVTMYVRRFLANLWYQIHKIPMSKNINNQNVYSKYSEIIRRRLRTEKLEEIFLLSRNTLYFQANLWYHIHNITMSQNNIGNVESDRTLVVDRKFKANYFSGVDMYISSWICDSKFTGRQCRKLQTTQNDWWWLDVGWWEKIVREFLWCCICKTHVQPNLRNHIYKIPMPKNTNDEKCAETVGGDRALVEDRRFEENFCFDVGRAHFQSNVYQWRRIQMLQNTIDENVPQLIIGVGRTLIENKRFEEKKKIGVGRPHFQTNVYQWRKIPMLQNTIDKNVPQLIIGFDRTLIENKRFEQKFLAVYVKCISRWICKTKFHKKNTNWIWSDVDWRQKIWIE